jgi:formamidopyrimidine-DNA glycosylase
MPELPDLAVIREVLAERLPGQRVTAARELRPLIVRNLLDAGGDLAGRLVGRSFGEVRRRGKFLLLGLDDGTALVVNPMLVGRLRYGPPLPRDRTRDVLALGLASGMELRYHDAEGMGKIYLTLDLGQVPTFLDLGPDADDPALTPTLFRERLRRHTGEIKGVLTTQEFVAGIGNAYADEICWRAGLYPFRRRASLDDAETERLFVAMRETLAEAIATLRQRLGETIDVEVRDFLAVHGKPGQPCPRCGAAISEVTRERRATNFCRRCQPGLMVAPGRRL